MYALTLHELAHMKGQKILLHDYRFKDFIKATVYEIDTKNSILAVKYTTDTEFDFHKFTYGANILAYLPVSDAELENRFSEVVKCEL